MSPVIFMLAVDVILVVTIVVTFLLGWLSTYADYIGYKFINVVFSVSIGIFVVWTVLSVAVITVLKVFIHLGILDITLL